MTIKCQSVSERIANSGTAAQRHSGTAAQRHSGTAAFNLLSNCLRLLIITAAMIIFTDTVNAQVQCYESKWTYTSGLINNRLEWLERGFVALNRWGTVINPTLPIHKNRCINSQENNYCKLNLGLL